MTEMDMNGIRCKICGEKQKIYREINIVNTHSHRVVYSINIKRE